MEVDGINLAVGGGAVSAIAGLAGAWIKAKFGKTTVPQPLETREEPRFVTCDQCAEHRKAINAPEGILDKVYAYREKWGAN